MEQINFQKILDDAENLKPEDGAPIFKFTSVGDRIVAKFVGRRRGIKTQQQENAIVLDVDIQASELIGDQPVTGPYSVFESGHITQIMDRANLKPGDVFVLKLDNVNRKSRFKKFAFQRIAAANGSEEPPDFGDGPPFDDEPQPPPEFFEERGRR